MVSGKKKKETDYSRDVNKNYMLSFSNKYDQPSNPIDRATGLTRNDLIYCKIFNKLH